MTKVGGGGTTGRAALTRRLILLLLSLLLNMFPLSPCKIPPARAERQCATNPGGGTIFPAN